MSPVPVTQKHDELEAGHGTEPAPENYRSELEGEQFAGDCSLLNNIQDISMSNVIASDGG